MSVEIRKFTVEDYPQLSELSKAVYPEYSDSAAELQHWDENHDPKCKFQRWVVERDGDLIAVGHHDQFIGMYHPRKFQIEVSVHPEHRNQGIGSAMYDHILEALQPYDPLSLRTHAREDWTYSVRFLEKRGYKEGTRDWESRLDVAAFDLTPYATVEDKPHAHGIEIKTLNELKSDENWERRVFEMFAAVRRDVPRPEPETPLPYEFFVKNMLEDPDMLPDGFFVAVHNDEYVGMSNLWVSQTSDDIYTGLTGVKREYRRMGIALAMKIRGIAFVKERGNPVIKTWNESNNRGMLSINERLGFVKQPAWIDFQKVLQEEEAVQTEPLQVAV